VQDDHEAINVKLEQVHPDGSWSARVSQTRSEYNHLAACMRDAVSTTIYRRQADGGNATAMAYLGRTYEQGRGGLVKDETEAVQWYRKGAGTGDRFAMERLKTLGE
jgi:TPR repeat protein